jgi:hypothetical protein
VRDARAPGHSQAQRLHPPADVASASVVLELRPGRAWNATRWTPSCTWCPPASGPVAGARDRGRPERPHAEHRPRQRDRAGQRPVRPGAPPGNSYGDSIRNLLEPITGPGRVNAGSGGHGLLGHRGSPRAVQQRPGQVRSEQISENSTSKPGPQGMPGATSNTPPPAQRPTPAAPAGANAQTAQAGTPKAPAARPATTSWTAPCSTPASRPAACARHRRRAGGPRAARRRQRQGHPQRCRLPN